MPNSKTLPVVLIGAGVVAGAVALLGFSKPAPVIYPAGTYVPQTTAKTDFWSNFSANFSNLITAVSGGIAVVGSALKAQGSFSAIRPVLVSGSYQTALVATAAVKNLKVGDRLAVTSTGAGFTGTFSVVQFGGVYGDTVIVINKPYIMINTFAAVPAVTGTFIEL
jgi:hypothetical protein